MPSTYFSWQKGLRTTVDFVLLGRGRGKNSLLVISGLSLAHHFSTFGNIVNSFPRSISFTTIARDPCAINQRKAGSIVGTLSHRFCVPSVTGTSCQACNLHNNHLLSESTQRSRCGPLQRNMTAACSPLLGRVGLSAWHVDNLNWMNGQMSNFATQVDLPYSRKRVNCCINVSRCLKNQGSGCNNMVYKCFWFNTGGSSWISTHLREPGIKEFHTSSSAQYSSGAAPDLSFDGSIQEEQLENSTVSSDQRVLGDRTLKLLSGSCYLPHPAKEETGGEDAHFICIDEQAIGVADGVGGWADHGVDSGQYSRELMSHSVSAVQEEPKGSIDPARVLEKAYSSTKARGSSTACIIALTDQGIHAVNLGDSGFIVVRDGCNVLRSPVQQHDFNLTYQLERGNGSDLPSAAQVFTLPVEAGDVIIAGTDGLFDNLYNNEVTAVVVHAIRAGLGPQVTAQKIAALARQRALDRNRQTPFSTAAQDAGYRFYGGKLDDITVVVSYVTTNSCTTQDSTSQS